MENIVTVQLEDYLDLLEQIKNLNIQIEKQEKRFDELELNGIVTDTTETLSVFHPSTKVVEIKVWLDKDISDEGFKKLELLFKYLVPDKTAPTIELVKASGSKVYRFWNLFKK